jgi:hypothetical protein
MMMRIRMTVKKSNIDIGKNRRVRCKVSSFCQRLVHKWLRL